LSQSDDAHANNDTSKYGSNFTLTAVQDQTTLAHKVSLFLGSKEPLTFRDITPSHVPTEVKHLQQTVAGRDIDDAIIIVKLDSKNAIQKIYGSVFDELKNDLATPHVDKGESSSSLLANEIWQDSRSVANRYLQSISDFGAWEISQWSQDSAIRVISGKAQEIFRVTFFAKNTETSEVTRPQLVISPQTGEILETTETLNRDMQAGSGVGGNEMTTMTTYEWTSHAPDALTAETFLVTYDNGRCTMDISAVNGYWKNNVIVKSGINPTNAYEYRCDEFGETLEGSQYLKGAFSPINDATFNAQVAFNLYENFAITASNGPLGSINEQLEVRVNYGDNDNAFWNGSFIGLGNGERFFYPKVSADTIGHEVAHAFLDNYSQINQSAGISMGIAESFADIAGEVTEYAIKDKQSKTNDWKYGADTYKPTLVEAARYFEVPSTDGKSIDSAKDWNYEVIGHHLAGPMNKAFYHLVNDNPDWDPIIGFDLWVTAAATYWTPSMLYEDAADGILDAVSQFRNNNTRLSSSWSKDDIRYAVIRAFAKADIVVRTDKLTVALFDYERSFDDIVLTNETSSKSWINPTYEWDINDDGSIDRNTTTLDETIRISPPTNSDTLTVKLTANANGSTDSYVRALDLSPEYCKPSGSGGTADYIKQVGLNGGSYDQTGSEAGGYGDYTHLPPLELSLSATNTFTFTPNDSSFTRQWVVFVDLNGDHDFDDAGEKLGKKAGKGDVSLSVTLSGLSESLNGLETRMRVITDWASMERPCAFASSGEYEDYRVTLTTENVDPDPDPDPDPVVSFSIGSSIGDTNATLTDTSTDVPAETTWLWQYKLEGDSVYSEISTNQNTSYDFVEFGRYLIKLTLTLKDGAEFSEETLLVLKDNDIDQPTYCSAGSTHSAQFINRFGIRHSGNVWNVLYNSSGAPPTPDGYTFFDLAENKGPISSTVRNWFYLNSAGRSYVKMWLDKGRDGSFDAEDEILSEDVNNNRFTTFQLGTGYTAGEPYRLRIFLRSDQFPGPCDQLDDSGIQGEVEDYTVFVQ
jgi:Zn-dependent metalloprotease